jgi:hypothetical protein
MNDRQHLPGDFYILLHDFKKMSDAGQSVTLSPLALKFFHEVIENMAYSYETIAQMLLERHVNSEDVAHLIDELQGYEE